MVNNLLAIFGILSLLVLTSFNLQNEPNEFLRTKIENQKIIPLNAHDETIHCVETLSKVYINRGFTLVWKNKIIIEQLISSIGAADKEGLNPNDYHFEKLSQLLMRYSKLKPEEKAGLDMLATDAFLLYTTHLLSGKVNPKSIDPEWHVKRREGNPTMLFEKAIEENNVKGYISEAIPKHETYHGLKRALEMYQTIKASGGWSTVADGETLKKGDENERVSAVKNRLLVTQDLNKSDLGENAQFDEKLYNAIIQFQKRHNLDLDGCVGKQTLASLNISVDDRIDQIKVNLERWRWLPQEFSSYYIIVNIANFNVNVFKNGVNKKQFKAVVGKSLRKTPVFSSKMSYLVLNPTWTVPPTILNVDVIPAVRKDINYLKKKNLKIYDKSGSLIDPSTVNWNSSEAKSYTYRQAAGPDNALGAVKFMFPNEFSVYLHDTPSRELFDKTDRSLSSGCIRVQNPLHLAEFLLNDPVNWSLEKIQKVIDTKKTLTVSLTEQPDIHILYWTSWINEEGNIQFRKDLYDRDNAVINSLKAKK